MMYWYGNGMSGWGYALMTVSTIVFWAVIIAGAVALVRYLGRRPQNSVEARPTPEQLLADRFARGEIDAGEYQHALDVLHQRHRSDSDF
ncbi:SHOCT domain-containing protein [Amycolatopsis sp. GM8]|uniref:SHOCT domain-containing protein n=1 Tax=Amycolatopsis sp. GM8 TaxID=2896530 RepID=UPI001F1F12D3|nr:SHOCT domain-containing protein [Amycolatopsis sp. GM8]